MDNYFLPKDFDIDIDNNYCSSYQYGTNETSPHWHSGAEIIFVVKGEVNLMFDDSWHVLKENSMLFIPPKQLHCCNCTDKNAEKIVVGFTEKFLGQSGIGLRLPKEINHHCILNNLESTVLPYLIKSFDSCCRSGSMYSQGLMAKSFLLQAYAFLIEHWHSIGLIENNDTNNKTSSHIYEYIEKHFAEELSPYDVAKQFNISYSYLAKEMQEHGHTSFTKYVNQIRIENAKRLLALTQKSITEVGLDCGFSVTSYFIKIFKEFTHMTPKAYRNLLKQKNSNN